MANIARAIARIRYNHSSNTFFPQILDRCPENHIVTALAAAAMPRRFPPSASPPPKPTAYLGRWMSVGGANGVQ